VRLLTTHCYAVHDEEEKLMAPLLWFERVLAAFMATLCEPLDVAPASALGRIDGDERGRLRLCCRFPGW
jgi:hypothetical protein